MASLWHVCSFFNTAVIDSCRQASFSVATEFLACVIGLGRMGLAEEFNLLVLVLDHPLPSYTFTFIAISPKSFPCPSSSITIIFNRKQSSFVHRSRSVKSTDTGREEANSERMGNIMIDVCM